uniref:Major facilitator superfamily (MFS) profile domain-containing protein n=1 Tax=Periophthalmus magnuspinnatus TaxID=409849 RepID=A0A3B4AKM6_9GOBI
MSQYDYDKSTAFLGEWESYQWRVLLLLSLTIVPSGFTGLSIVFLGDTPAHRCHIPAAANLSAAWVNISIPPEPERTGESGAAEPSQCARYKLHALREFTERGLEPGDVNVSGLETEPCLDGWDYDTSVYTSTIITEWDLVCDDSWKNPLTSSINFCGVLAGSFVSGQLSDRFGRKVVLFASLALSNVTSFLQIFSPSWPVFCAFYFVIGMGRISSYVTAFVLGMEVLSPRVRTAFSTAGVCLFFAAGYMLLPLFAFFLRDWKNLLLGLTLPSLALVPLWWYVPESPRWLLSQGRIQEAEVLIEKAAKINKMDAPQIIFKSLQVNDFIWTSSVCPVFRTSVHRMRTVPAYVLSWVMFHWCPRRLCLSSSLVLCGGFLLLIPFIPQNLTSFAVALEMLGKFGVTTAFTIIYAFTAELYPTVLRNTALATCSMAARLGSIIAPYFIYLGRFWVSLPYVLMGALTVLTGALSLLLPESRGLPLPETVGQMQPFPGYGPRTKPGLNQD